MGKELSRFLKKLLRRKELAHGQKRKPGIYLLTDTGEVAEILLVDEEGQETHLPKQSPAEMLIDFLRRDFSAYRASVERLWEEHDVFEDKSDVPYTEYEDFARQAVPLAEQLSEFAPAEHRDVLLHIGPAISMEDDGGPIFPSRKGLAVLNALRRPYFLQNRMKNIFEIAFADYERGTQQDRFRALEGAWPGIVDRSFSIRFLPDTGRSPHEGFVRSMHWRTCSSCTLRCCPCTSSSLNSGSPAVRTAGGISYPRRRPNPGIAMVR